MPVRFQLVIDCADPDRLARFWAAALGYELAPAPAGFATWNDFYRELGVPEEELVDGADRISDPEGLGPSIWFHVVPDAKAVKNRLHLDIHASGERTDPIETRRKRVISTDRSSRGSNHVKVKSTSKAGGRTGRPGFAPWRPWVVVEQSKGRSRLAHVEDPVVGSLSAVVSSMPPSSSCLAVTLSGASAMSLPPSCIQFHWPMVGSLAEIVAS